MLVVSVTATDEIAWTLLWDEMPANQVVSTDSFELAMWDAMTAAKAVTTVESVSKMEVLAIEAFSKEELMLQEISCALNIWVYAHSYVVAELLMNLATVVSIMSLGLLM